MRIACLLGPGFEDSEFEKPYNQFRAAGHTVTVIGVESGKELQGDKGRVKFTTEKAIGDVSTEEFDALFIPGGHSPDKLRANNKIVEFTQSMVDAGKPIFAICHGPQLLLTADRFKGKTMTAWKTIQGDLQKAGANVVDKEVVVDGNIVTSRQPDDIPAFVEKSLGLLSGGMAKAS
jgi:protease I